MRLAPAALALLTVACAAETTYDGIAVGNATLAIDTPAAPDVQGLSATWSVDRLAVLDCDGGATNLVENELIALDGPTAKWTLPEGLWCGVRAEAEAPARWMATSTDGFAISVALDLGSLQALGTTPIDGEAEVALVWSLGGRPWLDAKELGADDGPVTIEAGTDKYDDLLQAVRDDAVLFLDKDDDGVRDPDDDLLDGDDDDDTDDDSDSDSDDDTDTDDDS